MNVKTNEIDAAPIAFSLGDAVAHVLVHIIALHPSMATKNNELDDGCTSEAEQFGGKLT